jgi:hypothetical protein
MVDDNFGARKSIKNILKVFQDMTLRKIFGFRRKELTECHREMRNEELIICSLHQILQGGLAKEVEMGTACTT